MAPIGVVAAMMLMIGIIIFSVAPVFAQSGSAGGSAQSQISYKTAYPKVSADSSSSMTVQSEHHLYKPGDTVKITGSVSSEMRQESESDTVEVRIADAQGMLVASEQAQVNTNGEYSASIQLPSSAEAGTYSAGSKLQVEVSILGLLDAEIVAKLESSTAFVIASESSLTVTAQTDAGAEQEFAVNIASNSTVENVELNQDEKMVTFRVDGEKGTRGVTQVTIPKAMLSGEMMVMIDGQVITPESNEVIVTSNTNTATTFEINYTHSEHDVAVTGTNVVPEFSISMLVMAAAVGSIITVVALARSSNHWFKI